MQSVPTSQLSERAAVQWAMTAGLLCWASSNCCPAGARDRQQLCGLSLNVHDFSRLPALFPALVAVMPCATFKYVVLLYSAGGVLQ